MRRIAASVLLLCFLALGSGAAEWAHNLAHEREDALEEAAAHQAGMPEKPQPAHDDSNCPTHAQLHMPILSVAWAPSLVCLGVLVAFLTLLSPALVSQRSVYAIDCRGPPFCGC